MKKLKGIKLPHFKKTAGFVPCEMPVPATLYYPMQQNIGAPAIPCVKVGDKVFVGTLIGEDSGFVSAPIYSGVSGTVKRIEDTVQPGGAFAPTVVIESDGEQTPDPSLTVPEVNDKQSFVDAVRKS